MSIRPNPHQGGHFGGGEFTTYNGFGSLAALFNSGLCAVLMGLLLMTRPERITINVFLFLFLLSHLLIYLGMCAAPLVLTPSDKLLGGYLLQLVCGIGLFVAAYRLVRTEGS